MPGLTELESQGEETVHRQAKTALQATVALEATHGGLANSHSWRSGEGLC